MQHLDRKPDKPAEQHKRQDPLAQVRSAAVEHRPAGPGRVQVGSWRNQPGRVVGTLPNSRAVGIDARILRSSQ